MTSTQYAGTGSGLMNTGSAVAAIVSPLAFGLIVDLTGSWVLPFAVCVSAPKADPADRLDQAIDLSQKMPPRWGSDPRRLGPHRAMTSAIDSI